MEYLCGKNTSIMIGIIFICSHMMVQEKSWPFYKTFDCDILLTTTWQFQNVQNKTKHEGNTSVS